MGKEMDYGFIIGMMGKRIRGDLQRRRIDFRKRF